LLASQAAASASKSETIITNFIIAFMIFSPSTLQRSARPRRRPASHCGL